MELPFRVTAAPATGTVSVLTSTRIVARGGSCENIGGKVAISVSRENAVRQSQHLAMRSRLVRTKSSDVIGIFSWDLAAVDIIDMPRQRGKTRFLFMGSPVK